MCEFTRPRSLFYLKIYNNDDCIIINANRITRELINRAFPQLPWYSTTVWKFYQRYENLSYLRIPRDNIDAELLELLENLKLWANECNKYIWLGTNSNTAAYFYGTELDFCVATDWNMHFNGHNHTECGDAEYKLKYVMPIGGLPNDEIRRCWEIIDRYVFASLNCLPYNLQSFFVTTIPAIEEKQNKFSWKLARRVATNYNLEFLNTTLVHDKPDIKQQTIENKVNVWNQIYCSNQNLSMSHDVRGRDVLIIDDLYQSGASIWCYASFLKSLGANTVIAVTAVKSLRDGDNR